MQEFISKKRVIKITDHWNNRFQYLLQDYVQWISQGTVYVAKEKLKGANWNMIIPIVTTIPEESNLVFHKTSKFPRHKLGLTTFKRKIKEKGANYIVGNFSSPHVQDTVSWKHAFETDDTIYVTHLDTINFNVLELEHGVQLSYAKQYNDYVCISASKENLFYFDYIQGKHSLPVISDKDLNALVDKKQERLSIEELSTIIEMIKSRDKENVNLALKLFAQFNLSADPLMAWSFLSIYARHFSGINSVLYTNLKEQFNPSRHLWYMGLLNHYKVNMPKDDHERDLINRLLADYIIIDRLSVNTVLEFKNLGYKIEIDGL